MNTRKPGAARNEQLVTNVCQPCVQVVHACVACCKNVVNEPNTYHANNPVGVSLQGVHNIPRNFKRKKCRTSSFKSSGGFHAVYNRATTCVTLILISDGKPILDLSIFYVTRFYNFTWIG